MSTHTQILYQIVYSTKHRRPCMRKGARDDLFRYMYGILNHHGCQPLIINGVEDHLHILVRIHPSVALADLVKEIKVSTNRFIKEYALFPGFKGWQNGYGAFTYSNEALPNLIRYIRNQEQHHARRSFRMEYLALLEEQGVEYDERYVFE